MDYTWDLSVLYQSFQDEALKNDFARLQALTKETMTQFELGNDISLEQLADADENIAFLFGKLNNFAMLTLSVDATNEAAQRLMDRLESLSVQISLLDSAYTRYVGSLSNLEEQIASSPKLQAIDFSLRCRQEAARHLMDPAIEKWMLQMSLSGAHAFSNLRDKLDATLMVNYRGKSIPLSAARNLAYDADPVVRKEAYEAELKSYEKIEIPMAACLNGIKGEALTLIQAKHFDSVLEDTLFQSNMDQKTLDAMFAAIDEALPAFRKYLRRKGELFGHPDGIPFYDLFAPLSLEGNAEVFTIEQAREKLITEMSRFSPEMGQFINQAFENRWIDFLPREGKQGGAFCSEMNGMKMSRVLANFSGSFNDVSTLAHELGHAWHNRCMEDLPICMTQAPMPLAETASIFNETLLANAAMQQADPQQKLALLESDLMNAAQTIVDIYSRFLFEAEVIERRKDHTLSAPELKEIMLDAQEKTYGDGLAKDARHPYMWACKCHYYFSSFSFYNFPYAFGQLFGAGMYMQYLEQGDSFVPKYNKLLRSCGSAKVADVAASVGINVQDISFWRKALHYYVQEIDQFLELTKPL